MARILITGGSGLIGTHLTWALRRDGHQVRWLSRTAGEHDSVKAFAWDLDRGLLDEAALDGVDHIVHLAGAGIADKRWNEARIRKLIESRTRGPELLRDACSRTGQWPKSFISAAGIGYYGAVTSAHAFVEDDPPGTDTIARISVAWEKAVDEWTPHARVVKLRTSVVLAKDEGALRPLARIARWGLASPIGSGKQIMPWIHIADLVEAYMLAIRDEGMRGACNIAAPEQPDNRTFMRALAKALHRPFIMPVVPGFVLRAVLGDVAEVLLNGSAVSVELARKAGSTTRYATLDAALGDLLRTGPSGYP